MKIKKTKKLKFFNLEVIEQDAPSGQDVTTDPQPNQEEPKDNSKWDDPKDPKDDVEANKTKALEQEREKRKAAEAKVAEYEAKERAAQEAEMKKKWKYEDLISEKDKTIEQLQSQVNELTPVKEKFETQMAKQIDELKAKIPDGKKDFVNKLLDGKTHDQQVEILNEMSKERKGYDPNAWKGGGSPVVKPNNAKEAINNIAKSFFKA